jgi:hypothetical protein
VGGTRVHEPVSIAGAMVRGAQPRAQADHASSIRAHYLDRHIPLQRSVTGAIDLAYLARTEGREDLVRIRRR